MIHALKIKPEYFTAIKNGEKTYEIRFNDRGFSIDDYVGLNEWDGKGYTGRSIIARIIGVAEYPQFLKPDYVVLQLHDIRETTNDSRYAHYCKNK